MKTAARGLGHADISQLNTPNGSCIELNILPLRDVLLQHFINFGLLCYIGTQYFYYGNTAS